MLYASQIAQANGKPIKNAAIVYADNAYGESQNKGLVSQAKTLGINVTIDEAYSPTITDATPVARKVLASKPDVIFSIAYVTDGVLLVRSLKSQGNTAPIVGGTGGYVTADFGSAIGNDANGVLTIDTSDPDVYGAFATEYQKKYGAFPAQEAHDQAAGLYAVVQALEQKPTTDPTVLNETLHSGTFDLAAAGTMPGGKLKWDEAGANSIGKPLMVQWQEGKLVGVWPSELTSHKPIWGH
jgi:branched-chain amino acid transport system substrate-binding protein